MMKFVLFSSPDVVDDEAALLCAMLEQGIDVLHLRKPTWHREDIATLIENIPQRWYHRIVLHSHHELVREYGLVGVHIPEALRISTPAYAVQCREQGIRHVSTSLHTLAALDELCDAYDYATLSPVFDSISKQGYRSAFSMEKLSRAVQHSPCAVIALGGVCKENIHELKAMGFAGVAVLGAVWHSRHPVRACEHLLACLR